MQESVMFRLSVFFISIRLVLWVGGNDSYFTLIVYVQSWTSPGGNTPQDTNCTATCPLSRKLFKLDEPDMQDTAGEAGTNS